MISQLIRHEMGLKIHDLHMSRDRILGQELTTHMSRDGTYEANLAKLGHKKFGSGLLSG